MAYIIIYYIIICSYFIRPRLEYGNILFERAPKYVLDRLDNIEFNALRIITGGISNTSRTELSKELGIKLLKDRRESHTLTFFYKIVNGLAPSYLSEILESFKTNSCYNLRNNLIYQPYAIKKMVHIRSFFPYALKLWNSLLPEHRNAPTLIMFKTKLKPHPQRNTQYYYGQRWANVHHARLRMSCSLLNADLCNSVHVLENPSCKCGWHTENFEHYIKHCPTFTEHRNQLIRELDELGIGLLDNKPDTNLLLYGSSTVSTKLINQMFDILYKYFLDTKRFVNQSHEL